MWPVLSSHLPSRIWEYYVGNQVSKLDIHKSMGQERTYPRMWREVAKVTTRTALYLLQKVPRNQERFLKSGNRQVLHACEHEGRSGELFADRAPFSFHKDFEENPCENHVPSHGGQEGNWEQHGSTKSKLWQNSLSAWSEEMAGMMDERRGYLPLLGFCKACYMAK